MSILFIVQKKISARVRVALGKQGLTDDNYLTVYEDSQPYLLSLIQFYRVVKKKHMVDSEQAMDWANTGLLKFWVEKNDVNLVPDRYYQMAEVSPSEYKGSQS